MTPEEVRREEKLELKELLRYPSFRKLVWRMLSRCDIYSDGFAADHAAASFLSGKRNIGLWLVRELMEADPESYLMMQIENMEDQNGE